MGYLTGFRLDPPRGKNFRAALVLFAKADDHDCLHNHQSDYIELVQLDNAVICMRKLRR